MKKITVAKSAGFCFGVRRAIELALKTSRSQKNVFLLGDIVHNWRVVNDIKKSGIKKIDKLAKNKGGVLIIRAHGAAKKVYDIAKKNGYTIIDATCPMVKEIQSIAKKYELKKYTIIIIGDKNHDEVIGIKGNLKSIPIIISSESDIKKNQLKKIKKAAVIMQSTQDTQKAEMLFNRIKALTGKAIFCNTICHPTRQKQKEIREMPPKHDLMIIIGAKNSGNTKRLYEISKRLNQNTYWVNSKQQIKKEWFKSQENIGIAAGASTPDYIIKEIQLQIASF